MTAFPHIYITNASASKESSIVLTSDNLSSIEVTAPPQFGGPDGFWNPEAFFCASVSTCFVLTFRAIARGMKLDWSNLQVEVRSYLDKQEGRLFFTKLEIFAQLEAVGENDIDPFLKALKKAEESCLITNSVNAEKILYPTVKIINKVLT